MSTKASPHAHVRDRRRATLVPAHVLALSLGLLLVICAGARAGTYTINNCPYAPAADNNPGSWTIFGSPQADAGGCDGAGSFFGPLGGSMGPNSLAGVQISVPAGSGITIQHAKLWWYVAGSSGATTFAIVSASGNVVLQAYGPHDARSTPDDVVLPSNTTSLTAAAYCSSDDYSNGCSYGAGDNEILGLYGSQLTLADSNLPGASITGGSLAGSGPVDGVATISFTATDPDSGVRYVQLLVDGKEVAEHDYIADCPYQDFAACPHAISDTITWNTTAVPNGEHDLALRVINAAQNPATIGDHTITIENPASGAALGEPNGDSPCAGETLNLSIRHKAPRATIGYGRALTIDGLLHCGLVPISEARVLISGGRLSGSVATGPSGAFAFAVPKGPDRTLTFSYIPYSGEITPAAQATARIAVIPRLRLRISPRSLLNGQVMHWSGRVRGGPYPRSGVTLDAEVLEGRDWKVFDQLKSSRTGRFRYSYRFTRTFSPTTYRFRIASPLTGAHGYSYAPGFSRAVAENVT